MFNGEWEASTRTRCICLASIYYSNQEGAIEAFAVSVVKALMQKQAASENIRQTDIVQSI